MVPGDSQFIEMMEVGLYVLRSNTRFRLSGGLLSSQITKSSVFVEDMSPVSLLMRPSNILSTPSMREVIRVSSPLVQRYAFTSASVTYFGIEFLLFCYFFCWCYYCIWDFLFKDV